jgi:uncharacterized phage-associated protein
MKLLYLQFTLKIIMMSSENINSNILYQKFTQLLKSLYFQFIMDGEGGYRNDTQAKEIKEMYADVDALVKKHLEKINEIQNKRV